MHFIALKSLIMSFCAVFGVLSNPFVFRLYQKFKIKTQRRPSDLISLLAEDAEAL